MHVAVLLTVFVMMTVYSSWKRTMTSPLIQTEFACTTQCKYCRVTGHCPKVNIADEYVNTPRAPRAWNPSDGSEDAVLRCGDTIPWPIIRCFAGDMIGKIWCSQHGWQPKLTKEQIDKAKKKKIKKEGNTFDDIPPF